MKRGLAAGVGLAVILGTYIFVLPEFANYGDVWAAVKDLSWRWIAILLATVALNIATFAPPWMAALPGLRFLPALTVTQASTASTYLAPGGPAVGVGLSAAILLDWGFNAAAVRPTGAATCPTSRITPPAAGSASSPTANPVFACT